MRIPGAEGSPTGDANPPTVIDTASVARDIKPRLVAHSAPPAALSATPNLVGLLLALRRRWFLALSLGLLLAPAAAFAAWTLRPITFTARTLLHVTSNQPKLLYELPDSRGDFGNYQRVQIALVKSRWVLNAALRDPKVEKLEIVNSQEDPLAWLEREIQIDFSTAPEIMRISMTGPDSKTVQTLVDAVRKAYLVEIVQKETRTRQARLDQLKKWFAEYDSSLRDKRETLKRMARGVGTKDPKLMAAKQEFRAQHLRDLQTELLKRQSERRTTELELSNSQARESAGASATVAAGVIEEQIKKDPVVIRLQNEIEQHEVDLADFRKRSPAPQKEPGFRKITQFQQAAKELLAKRREEILPAITGQLRDKARDDVQIVRLQHEDRVRFLTEIEKRLEDEIDRNSKDVNAFKNEVVDLEWLTDEIAQLDAQNKEVTRQMQALQVEMQAPPRVTELEPGEQPVVVPAQTESNRIRLAGGAGLGSFLAIVLGIALLEFRCRRVNSADEVVRGLKMKLVGSLPLVPRRALMGRANKAHNLHWQNRLTESVDAIRTTLLNAARFEGLRMVMVTSALGGEGKTLLSCHLAVSLARAGRKTLLVDGDLRRPAVHKLFDLPLERGLSELLRGELEPAAVANTSPLDGLTVITAGQSDVRAIQNLARDRIAEVLRRFHDSYEFVVIDSAPVLPVADAQLIGQHVDGVVFSVMRDVSRLPAVYAACERLALLRVPILGAVINGIQGGPYHSSNYYNSMPPTSAPSHAETQAST
jgi:capsular exopolysaccharide synthesis family protein